MDHHVWLVCDRGQWFRASEGLSRHLEQQYSKRPARVACFARVSTGRNAMGLRWAERDGWHVLAYAQGGYAAMKRVPGIGLTLLSRDEDMPEDVERSLCCALGLDYVPDEPAPVPAGWSHI